MSFVYTLLTEMFWVMAFAAVVTGKIQVAADFIRMTGRAPRDDRD